MFRRSGTHRCSDELQNGSQRVCHCHFRRDFLRVGVPPRHSPPLVFPPGGRGEGGRERAAKSVSRETDSQTSFPASSPYTGRVGEGFRVFCTRSTVGRRNRNRRNAVDAELRQHRHVVRAVIAYTALALLAVRLAHGRRASRGTRALCHQIAVRAAAPLRFPPWTGGKRTQAGGYFPRAARFSAMNCR